MIARQLIVPWLLDSPGVIPRNTQVLFGFTATCCLRVLHFSSETSAPESTRNEHGLFATLIGTLIKFEAATLIVYTALLFLKKVGSAVDFVAEVVVVVSCSSSVDLGFAHTVVECVLHFA